MHHRHEKTNIPTELLRTLVRVVETESFTRAGESLKLTQAAVSNQIKRLQTLLGGKLFTKSGPGLRLTKQGLVVVDHARRILAMNDHLLAVAGPNPGLQQFRIGMPRWVGHPRVADVIRGCSAAAPDERLSYRCDELETLVRDLGAGLLDLAFLCEVASPAGFVAVKEWRESVYWVASPSFRLIPGGPIPLIGWPGSFTDRTAVAAFHALGIQCLTAFASPDMGVRLAAAEEGVGILLANGRCVSSKLRTVVLPNLPAPPQVRTGIYIREALDARRYQPIIRAFEHALRPPLLEEHSDPTSAADRKGKPPLQRRPASPVGSIA